MNVAVGEFLTRGYEGASIARIARVARVSPKTLYARYANKDELLLAVVAQLTAGSRDHLANALADPSAKLEQALTEFATVLAHHWTSEREIGLYRLVVAEAVRFPHLGVVYRESIDAFRSMFEQFLVEQMARGLLVVDDVSAACEIFTFVTIGQIREQTLLGERPSPGDVKKMVARGVSLFLAGYRRP
jgi:AcrR family transcriptional regulator